MSFPSTAAIASILRSTILVKRGRSFFKLPLRHYATDGAIPDKKKATPKRLVVAMTGATGAVLGIRLLEALRSLNVETHLVISKWAEATIKYESEVSIHDVRALASHAYSLKDQSAAISSGSFHHDGMIIVPCTMKTLAGVASGYSDDLITRAADVTLKERKPLVLVTRETPLSAIHLRNMQTVTSAGGVIFPPMPAFYTHPHTLDDVVNQSVGRMLDMFGIDMNNFERWAGFRR